MIERLADQAVSSLLDRIAARAAEELPSVAIERRTDAIVLSGPGIVLRRLTDARLRGLAAAAARLG